MDMSFSSIDFRIQQASKTLKITEADLIECLKNTLGIEPDQEGLQLLDAETTTEDIIFSSLTPVVKAPSGAVYYKSGPDSSFPLLARKAASAILKGRDPFKKSEQVSGKIVEPTITNNSGSWQVSPTTTTSNAQLLDGSIVANQFIDLARSLRDPKQMKDKELLEMYNRDRDYGIEQELHHRANYGAFVVLKPGPKIFDTSESIGKKAIDIDMSLDLLKRSRRMVNPSIVRQGDVFVNVYRISELNPEDQVIEMCPFCKEALYKGYCEADNADFSGMSDNVKAFIHLITKSANYEKSDRKDILISAGKGLDDLRKTWPKVAREYDRLDLVNDLPRLKISRSLPNSKPADPFHTK
jgi:hypothetical protein